jgi:hypothetical protein
MRRRSAKVHQHLGQAGWPQEAVSVFSLRNAVKALEWGKVFRLSFTYLMLCYPGITLRVLRLFKCQTVEGVRYLTADLRLRCFTPQWFGYAAMGAVVLVVFSIGLPCAVFGVLKRHRNTLFGGDSETTRASWGFLYEAYGSTAWWWELEELLRKLLLICCVVVLDEKSPLQVFAAVFVCALAHVLHAAFEPWGVWSQTYTLQHLSLLSTTFVFVMGLLFKSGSLSNTSVSGSVLSAVMLAMCSVFVVAWVWVMIRDTVIRYISGRRAAAIAKSRAALSETVMALSNPMQGALGRSGSNSRLSGSLRRMLSSKLSRLAGGGGSKTHLTEQRQPKAPIRGNRMSRVAHISETKQDRRGSFLPGAFADRGAKSKVSPLMGVMIDGIGGDGSLGLARVRTRNDRVVSHTAVVRRDGGGDHGGLSESRLASLVGYSSTSAPIRSQARKLRVKIVVDDPASRDIAPLSSNTRDRDGSLTLPRVNPLLKLLSRSGSGLQRSPDIGITSLDTQDVSVFGSNPMTSTPVALAGPTPTRPGNPEHNPTTIATVAALQFAKKPTLRNTIARHRDSPA